jgi:molecular chaperone DnaK
VGKNPISVGKEAYEEWSRRNPNVAARFKLQMGSNKPFQPEKTDPPFLPSKGSYTPTDLSSIVLSHLKQFTEEKGGKISEAVVTVPANWGNEAREATMSAAKQAGLSVKVIINEPTAAALYYAFKEGLADGNYAVFDLGGGTFDISIIKITGSDVEVLGSSGIQRLGGDDFDKALLKKVREKSKSEHGKDISEDSDIWTKYEAEKAKVALSKAEEASARPEPGFRLIITRAEFEALIADKLAQLKMLCEGVLDDLNMKPEDIAAPILVGGSTRIPCVRNLVQKVFKKEPIVTANVDEVVALGAAIYAARHADKANLTPLQAEAISKVKIQERTGRFLGTLSLMENESRGGKIELVNSVIIKKGEKLPARGSRSFFTIRGGQTKVLCRITESESEELDPTHVKVLNEGVPQELTLPPNRPAEQEIKVTYEYQIDQTVRCFFEDVSSGEKKEFVVSVSRTEGSKHSSLKKFVVE